MERAPTEYSAPATKHAWKRVAIAIPLIAGTLLLGACGTATGDRVGSGAGIGAAGGAAIGAIFGGVGALPGALIGAGVGAGTGYLTTPNDVNLGEPVWRR